MSIDKLTEFAKTGDKNTDDLDLEKGFPSRLQPARQWFNWILNKYSLKTNEIIDGLATQRQELLDALSNQRTEILQALADQREDLLIALANQKVEIMNAVQQKIDLLSEALTNMGNDLNQKITSLNQNKLDKTATAVAAKKLETAREIKLSGVISGTANFDGSGNIEIITSYVKGIGIGQEIRDVTSSRANGQSYRNTGDLPIQVIISLAQNTAHFAAVSKDGTNWINPVYGDGEASIPFSATIPPGWYVKATSFERWFELS
ncbi:hypothetical protein [Acinetobacter sp. A47]|uniref:hypothetical protein n=1 Tax=Acinetobacter sp. A47 TaxID=1561217 RepID=UPI00068E1057|nr:hypothetical protein [Acinetobacter sp. A47]